MGLDVYFYKRKKVAVDTVYTGEDVLKEISEISNNNESLLRLFKQLKDYSLKSGESLENCLYYALKNYVDTNEFYCDENDEVAYFRKFWYILEELGYSDKDYATDKIVTKEQLERLKTKAEKTIMMVEKDLKEKGWIVEKSPLNSDIDLVRNGGSYDSYISLKNGVFTDELEQEADAICEKVFDSNDSFLFWKVCELYFQFSRILKDTDFENETIVLNADW